MSQSGLHRGYLGWVRGALFAGIGLLLLATSGPARPSVRYSLAVDVPDTQLDNDSRAQRVTLLFTLLERDPEALLAPDIASATISLRATHSDDAPQAEPDNTPWVTIRPDTRDGLGATPLAGASAPAQDAGAGIGVPAGSASADEVVFLREGVLSLSRGAMLRGDGRGELAVVISRAQTARDIATTVEWQVSLTAEAAAPEDRQAVLPWSVEVVVTEGVAP